jgi:hypothetical protein
MLCLMVGSVAKYKFMVRNYRESIDQHSKISARIKN